MSTKADTDWRRAIHPDERALIRAIAYSPLDLAPRYALADWLQEQPDPESQTRGLDLARVLCPEHHDQYANVSCATVRTGAVRLQDWWYGFPRELYIPQPGCWPEAARELLDWPIHITQFAYLRPMQMTSPVRYIWTRSNGTTRPGVPGPISPRYWDRLQPWHKNGTESLYLLKAHALADLGHVITSDGRHHVGLPPVEFPRPWLDANA